MGKQIENTTRGSRSFGKSVRNLVGAVGIATFAFGALGCQNAVHENPPAMLTPPLPLVREGNPYQCLVQFSNADKYSIKVSPAAKYRGESEWNNFTLNPQSNGVYINGGTAPQVTEDTKYDATLSVSNRDYTEDFNWTITVIDSGSRNP